MLRALILGGLGLLATAGTVEAFMAGNPQAGEAIALAHCQACHAMGERAAADGKAEAPDFAAIAGDADAYPLDALRRSIDAPHWASDAPVLSTKDADNLIAFILSLRPD